MSTNVVSKVQLPDLFIYDPWRHMTFIERRVLTGRGYRQLRDIYLHHHHDLIVARIENRFKDKFNIQWQCIDKGKGSLHNSLAEVIFLYGEDNGEQSEAWRIARQKTRKTARYRRSERRRDWHQEWLTQLQNGAGVDSRSADSDLQYMG